MAKLESNLERHVERISNLVETKYEGLNERFSTSSSREDANRKFIVQISVALAAVLTTLGIAASTLLFFVISTTSETRIGPVREQAARTEEAVKLMGDALNRAITASAASTAKDQESTVDRANLNRRTEANTAAISEESTERKSQVAEISSRILEGETQFKGISTVLNLLLHEVEVLKARTYNLEVPGKRYPEITPFYPELYQPSPNAIGGTDGR
jgi:hypothetical protein